MVCHRTFLLPSLAIFYLLFHFSHVEAISDGFTVKLIRKNSLHSTNIIPNTAHSLVSAYIGEYLMELSIGTPPQKFYGIVDTGSSLIWTQCVPCINCYKQLNPLFDPQKSSTYTNISCDSDVCHKIQSVCSPKKNCNYTYQYVDADISHGVLAQETFTLTSTTGNPIPLNGILFGCGHNDSGLFNDHEMGVIGLNAAGPFSFISQIGPLVGGKKFSHCLVPFHTDIQISSPISFGKGSEVSGDGVVSTPLILNELNYRITLLGITVGSTFVPYSTGAIPKGNILMDSGTPTTYLPKQLYDRVADLVRQSVPMKPISDDPGLGTQLCYQTPTNLKGPMLTFHFEGADVVLTPTQTFIPPKDGVFCLAFSPSDSLTIYGNFAQSNYLIGFDIDRQVVSFKPTDCTKY